MALEYCNRQQWRACKPPVAMASLQATSSRMTSCSKYVCIIVFFFFSFFFLVLPPALENSVMSAAALSSTFLIKQEYSYPAIFVFGDSLSDTGNTAFVERTSNSTGAFRITETPYGSTFPGWPTGRYSDGRLLVDFLAFYLGLPSINPYLNSTRNFERGVNYAVGGAAALDTSSLYNLNISAGSNFSLNIQLLWHLNLKEKVESSNGSLQGLPTLNSFEDGLYVIEIGGDDYINAFFSNHSLLFVNNTLIPLVIQRVIETIEALLKNGAKRFLLISLTPLGCSPYFLANFDGFKDNDGCLEDYNLIALSHDQRLQDELISLQILYSHATFNFMDYFAAYTHILRNNKDFGLLKEFDACCGAGEEYPYNFNIVDLCNANSESICEDPNSYAIWDGLHPTESMNFHAFLQAFNISSFKGTKNSIL